jgi:lysophospholipase L1-like esterase
VLGAFVVASCTHPPPSTPAVDVARSHASHATRYLALGDSFTIGTGSEPSQSFPARLTARWQQAGTSVVLRNLGVNGYTTQNLIDRELPAAPDFAPTFVTLAIGANDIVHGSNVDTYRAQLRRIFDGLAAAGIPGARVVAIPQPDWALSPVAADFGDPAAIEQTIVAFNTALAEESARVGARYIDLFPLMRNEARARMIAGDGLHPNAEAYDAWADALARAL